MTNKRTLTQCHTSRDNLEFDMADTSVTTDGNGTDDEASTLVVPMLAGKKPKPAKDGILNETFSLNKVCFSI